MIGVRVNLTKIRHDVQNIANLVLDALRGHVTKALRVLARCVFVVGVAVGVGHLSVKDDFDGGGGFQNIFNHSHVFILLD